MLVPEGQGSSVGALLDRTAVPSQGEQASASRVLTPNKGLTASSGHFLSCCTGWWASVWALECRLQASLDGPSTWVLLVLTRNERGMADWVVTEVEIQQNKPAGVRKISSFMSLLEPHKVRCCTPAGTCSVTMPKLEVSFANRARHLHKGFHWG